MAKDNGNKVQIGRIVHYAAAEHSPDRGENCCNAALVVKVYQLGDDGKCNLAVFDANASMTVRPLVVRDAAGHLGAWHWPQECPDAAASS